MNFHALYPLPFPLPPSPLTFFLLSTFSYFTTPFLRTSDLKSDRRNDRCERIMRHSKCERIRKHIGFRSFRGVPIWNRPSNQNPLCFRIRQLLINAHADHVHVADWLWVCFQCRGWTLMHTELDLQSKYQFSLIKLKSVQNRALKNLLRAMFFEKLFSQLFLALLSQNHLFQIKTMLTKLLCSSSFTVVPVGNVHFCFWWEFARFPSIFLLRAHLFSKLWKSL